MDEILCSPPKLRRFVHVDKDIGVVATATPQVRPEPKLHETQDSSHSPAVEQISSLSLESAMVDGAIDNVATLPQMVSNVSAAQKGQSNEISKQLQILMSLEAELQKEEKSCSDIIIDVSNLTKKVFSTEDLVKEKQKACNQLEDDLNKILTNNSEIEKKLEGKWEEIERTNKTYTEYRNKIRKHSEVVENFVKSLPVYKDVTEKENNIARLQEKGNDLCRNSERTRSVCSGQVEEELREQNIHLKKKEESMLKEINNKQKQIERLKQQAQRVEQANKVLQKRNNAQLTRLKCQVKDQQLSHSQWSDQVAHMKKMISDYQSQIDNNS